MLTGATSEATGAQARTSTLNRETFIRAFRIMRMSRSIDDREVLLKRQQKIFFQISAAGHEAIQCAAGMALRPGKDWFFPYYRDRTACLALGLTAEQMLLQAVGAAADKQSGGRQMPSHWSSPELHIVSPSSATGTQFLPAVGCAHASKLLDPGSEEVTLTMTGDGATSEGEFWEALNAACLEQLAMVFVVEDNGWAISVPVEKQTAGGNIAKVFTGLPGLTILQCDGTDFPESYRTMVEAVTHAREKKMPVLVHATCIRPYSHSLSDDESKYKSKAERDEEEKRDPMTRYPEWLIAEGLATREEIDRISAEVHAEIREATDKALVAEPPPAGETLKYLYSPDVDPTSDAFSVPPEFSGEPRTMVDSINRTLHDEMGRNEKIIVYGEDVADCSHDENMGEVKGKGGVFTATLGLQRTYGSKRVFNSPIAEAAIVGRANGMGTRGMKPVVEIQFFDYIWPAMMQIRDELASLRWRSYNGFSAPCVIRVAIGGYLNGGAVYHSQCGEVAFTHIPGIRVVFPSNALDAAGLLRTAIRCDDPVLFLEHKRLYREPYNRSPYPGPDFMIPFGKAKTAKTGDHLTIVTYGALVQKSLQAALLVEQQDPRVTVEVIDLRSLSPYDWPAIAESVSKTSRVMIVHEDTQSWGYGAEIAARIADELFSHLDAPVGRVAAKDTWVAYHPKLETEILPQVDDILREASRLLAF